MSTFFESAGLGPVRGNTASVASLGFLSGTGILNLSALGTTATKVITGDTTKGDKIRRCKISCITASRNIAWATAPVGGATTSFKADADGSADEGTLIMGGSGAFEIVSIPANHDLYLVAGASSTVAQVTCFEV